MADESTSPAAEPELTPALLTSYHALGVYTTLQEAVSRLSRVPLGVVIDENDRPLSVVTREILSELLGGGKDAARAHGKMGARQAARERSGGTSGTDSLISVRDLLPPLVTAEMGAALQAVAAEAEAQHVAGVLVLQSGKRLGVIPTRTLARRAGPVAVGAAPEAATEAAPAEGTPTAGAET